MEDTKRRTERLEVRLRKDERQALKQLAERDGDTVAGATRRAILTAVRQAGAGR